MSKFDLYLRGRRFKLFTDHKPLVALSRMELKTFNNLRLKQNEYDFSVHYIPSDQNIADSLSRNPLLILEAVEQYSGNVKAAQRKDEFCLQIMKFLEWGILPTDESCKRFVDKHGRRFFIDENGVLCSRRFGHNQMGLPEIPLIVIPHEFRMSVMKDCHNSCLAGHRGIDGTLSRLFAKAYWPNMKQDVTQFVKRCQTCLRAKDRFVWSKFPLNPWKPVLGPGQQIHCDLSGPHLNKD